MLANKNFASDTVILTAKCPRTSSNTVILSRQTGLLQNEVEAMRASERQQQ